MASKHDFDHTLPERIKDKVLDYRGYSDVQQRRKSDNLVRDFLIRNLRELAEKLIKCTEQIRESAEVNLYEHLTKVVQKLRTISGSLDHPVYRNSSFFENETIPAEMLGDIYSHEMIMFTEVSNISEEIADLLNEPIVENEIKEHILRMDDALDALNQALFERESMLMGADFDA